MDHWGDPWADADAHDDEPPKHEIATPPPPRATFTSAPVLLNGFLDDAGWGSRGDEGLNGWAEEPRNSVIEDKTGWEDFDERRKADINEGYRNPPEQNGWNLVDEGAEELQEEDNVDPETSDSATTIQADVGTVTTVKDSAESLQADDDDSTRPSTSPSDTSRHEAPTESPRTSFEEERAAEKAQTAQHVVGSDGPEVISNEADPAVELEQVEAEDAEDDFGDFDTAQDPIEPQLEGDVEQNGSEASSLEDDRGTHVLAKSEATKSTAESRDTNEQGPDQGLISQLFPTTRKSSTLPEAPDDPVGTTSTRKAWYRLSRKQTMREYNTGNAADDNYIRVTWKTSHIRSEVIKTVSRWATEDRMAGRGPGARASFYWDTPAPPDQQMPYHARKKSSISVSNPVGLPTNNSVPKLNTDVPAAFNWSSPSVGTDPWSDSTGDARAVSSPVAPPKHSTVAKLQRQEKRPVSMDLSSRPKEPMSHKRTATTVNLTSPVPLTLLSPIPPPTPHTTTPPADPWASLGALDTNASSIPAPTAPQADEDDDDEWGEMVESPAVSSAHTPVALADLASFPEPSAFSEPPKRNNPPLSTPSTTSRSIRSSPLQPLAPTPPSKHASPIVRLKGTVSPTSALFKANAFVPASVEDGPIGPGLLRSRKRDGDGGGVEERGTAVKGVAQMDEVLGMDMNKADATTEKEEEKIADVEQQQFGDDDFSAFESSLPETPSTPPLMSSTPPPLHQQSTHNIPISNLDLSIFDTPSAPPPPAPPSTTDPWSIFDTTPPPPTIPPSTTSTPPHASTRPRSTTSLSTTSTIPFTRTPPRPATPPLKQPLTSATSAAQRRKAEEDEVVRGILGGLPDLGYMLRR